MQYTTYGGTHWGWVGLKAGLDGCRKPRPPGIRSPDRPVRSDSLYQLNYPGQRNPAIHS
jgi:hypothetical protein